MSLLSLRKISILELLVQAASFLPTFCQHSANLENSPFTALSAGISGCLRLGNLTDSILETIGGWGKVLGVGESAQMGGGGTLTAVDLAHSPLTICYPWGVFWGFMGCV